MIHLHRRIFELKKLLESKADPSVIRSKCTEIIKDCERLNDSDKGTFKVNMFLETIQNLAGRIMDSAKGRGLLRRNVNLDYIDALKLMETMEVDIREIGKILSIEFKEVES